LSSLAAGKKQPQRWRGGSKPKEPLHATLPTL
jgi:hypothetical protein